MELLCIFAALAVLFLFCAFLTLKCNLHAALAPLSALGIAVAWLTAAGMANLLLPGTVLLWAVFAGSGVWALVPHKGQRPACRRLVTPGAVLFWGMALAFAVYFFIRQPLATKYDELSLWATAVKVTKADNRLYALAILGTPWPQTQNPGLPLLSYFFQFLGHYADWKIYVAYDVLAAAVFAAVLGGLNFRQYRIAVPLAAICWFAPWFLTVYNHTIYLDTTYMTAYGDVPAGLALGGAVALWLALRKTGGPKWAVLPVLALAANIKANTFVLSLVAAGLMAVDAWLFAEHPFKKGLARRTGFAIACFAAPMLIYYFWNIRYVGILVAKSASEGGTGETSAPLSAVVINGIKILLGQPVEGFYAERQSQFTQAMADMGCWCSWWRPSAPEAASSSCALAASGRCPLHALWGITSCWRSAMALFSSRIRPWGWWIITAISIPTISAGSLWRWPAGALPCKPRMANRKPRPAAGLPWRARPVFC